jgi:AcrR family transcriptional regulator
MVTEKAPAARTPLSRERVLTTAVTLADEGGMEAVTMRGLADALGVEAMSLYYHVANKEALLDGVAEVIVDEINVHVADVPAATGPDDWQQAMRARILAARQVMLRHKWAPALLETRTNLSVPVLAYHHGLMEIFRTGGFSYDLVHHALHALGSRAIGFTQEMFDPAPGSEADEEPDVFPEEMAAMFPLMIEMLAEVSHDDPETNLGWCDDQTEFEFALDLLLDGLETRRRLEGGLT